MGDAFGQFRIKQNAGGGFAAQGKCNFRFCPMCAIRDIGLNRLFQRGKTFRRVVKIRDRVMQARRREIGQEFLKLPECPGRLKCLPRRFNGFKCPRSFDENINAPMIAVFITIKRLPVAGRNQREHAAERIRSAGGFSARCAVTRRTFSMSAGGFLKTC